MYKIIQVYKYSVTRYLLQSVVSGLIGLKYYWNIYNSRVGCTWIDTDLEELLAFVTNIL